MSYTRLAAALLVITMALAIAGPAQAQAVQGGSTGARGTSPEAKEHDNTALTVGEFNAKSADEQTDIVWDKVATMKKNLWSETFPNGQNKPDALLAQHRQIVVILDNHFTVTDPNQPPMAWLNLFSAINNADNNEALDQVFLAHIQQVLKTREQAQKKAPGR